MYVGGRYEGAAVIVRTVGDGTVLARCACCGTFAERLRRETSHRYTAQTVSSEGRPQRQQVQLPQDMLAVCKILAGLGGVGRRRLEVRTV